MIVSFVVGRVGWVCTLTGVLIGSSHVPLVEPPAHPAPAAPTVEVGRSQTAIRFDFAEGSLLDTTGRVLLRIATMGNGELSLVSHGEGWAVRFPEACDRDPRDCPRAILEAGSQDRLNPDTRPIRWGASVRLTRHEVSDGSNILQKGLSAAGTQFKLQVDGQAGQPSCVVAGQDDGQHRIFVALAADGIADGHWHRLECRRDGPSLRLLVDGQQVADIVVPTALSIVNDKPLRIGGKGVGPFNDQFHGILDDVFVEVG